MKSKDDFDLTSILHQPLFIPASSPISSVLPLMQREKKQFVIVLDEFGGTAGIATTEDILEELVGEMQDEFDRESPLFHREGNEIWVDGSVSMAEIENRFGPPTSQIESNTIGGYIAEVLQRIPNQDDRIPYGNFEICVTAMDAMRVERVSFTPNEIPEEES